MSRGATGRPLTRAEIVSLADQLRGLLAQLDARSLDASTATRYRIQGAVAALDAALGRPSTLLDESAVSPRNEEV